MLNQLELRWFKCFELLKLPLCPLTLLSGSNSSGKSSALQALVLLHQTMREHEWSIRLMLNGDVVALGNVADVVDKVHGRDTIEIGVVGESTTARWIFSGDRQEMSMAVESIAVGDVLPEKPSNLRHLLPPDRGGATELLADRLLCLTYITAERSGPRDIYKLEDPQIASTVGPTGEHAMSLLHLGRHEKVLEGLALPDVPNTRLHQVEERMRIHFPGCGMLIQQVPQTSSIILGLRNSEETDHHRPINAGFGLTQILPVIIAVLSADEGDVILIENPEVHLHPAGQALMGQFLAEAASAGVQIILETHSDHILNGVRRSVKSGLLTADQVAIHFFRPRSDAAAQVFSPNMDNSGNIDDWPEGFFDQFDKDMNHFAGWGE